MVGLKPALMLSGTVNVRLRQFDLTAHAALTPKTTQPVRHKRGGVEIAAAATTTIVLEPPRIAAGNQGASRRRRDRGARHAAFTRR